MQEQPGTRKVLEGVFTPKQIKQYNETGYNIYYLPNYPQEYRPGVTIDGSMVDTYKWVFVDCDLKDGVYTKDTFIERIASTNIAPTKIIDSGNGIHTYFEVSDLDAMSYLRFQRRLLRFFNTDEAVGQLFQLMRYPNTINTKNKHKQVICETLFEQDKIYTCEELDKLLPPITLADEEYCQQHYDKTHNLNQRTTEIDDTLPPKFGKLLRDNSEAKSLYAGESDDRSKADYRLAHIMLANDFTRNEALSVLVNSAKALQRAPKHRVTYAENIVDKIWTYEEPVTNTQQIDPNANTVRAILSRGEETLTGTRFACNRLIDDTVHGFRLGQVIGIIGGSGVGKTTLTLNTFLWFAQNNPDYHHFFFSLEQPVGEIAKRIHTICQGNESLFDKIHIVSNYADDGTYKHMSITDVEKECLDFQTNTGFKIGATVIDHIGVLKTDDDGLIGTCTKMKAVAVNVNMMLIMLSQAPREKAGIGDLELNKDAAYGTVFFESFVDYALCLWQPLKRAYSLGAPTVMAIKFAKIRHKKQGYDRIKEDVCYQLFFDPNTELVREMTQDEETAAKYFLQQATNMRKLDRKTDLVPYKSRRLEEVADDTTTVVSSKNSTRH